MVARRITLVAIAMIAAFTLAGCSPFLRTVPSPPRPSEGAGSIPEEGLEVTGSWDNRKGGRITFEPTGAVRGIDGCNEFAGTWAVDRSEPRTMTLDIEATTERRCVVGPTLLLDDRMTWARAGRSLAIASGTVSNTLQRDLD